MHRTKVVRFRRLMQLAGSSRNAKIDELKKKLTGLCATWPYTATCTVLFLLESDFGNSKVCQINLEIPYSTSITTGTIHVCV